MNPQEFITSKLQKIAQPVVAADIGKTPLDQVILARVHSKQFRKLSVDQAAIDVAKNSIAMSVQAGEPINLRLDFGGNKLWRLDEAPHIDWGELFALMYYVNWAKYIVEVYVPGVLLSYFSMDVCVERLNGVPHEQTDEYSKDMKALFAWAEQFIPAGVRLEYTRYADLYESRDEYYQELEAAKEIVMQSLNGKLPELSDKQKAATELNVKLKPGQADDPEWREKVEAEHQSIFYTKTGAVYMEDPKWIMHCPTWYSGYIATGSTKRSLAKFWAGVGALEAKAGGGFNEIILTPKQLESAEYSWQDVRIDGLEGENFGKIRIV